MELEGQQAQLLSQMALWDDPTTRVTTGQGTCRGRVLGSSRVLSLPWEFPEWILLAMGGDLALPLQNSLRGLEAVGTQR